MAYNSPQRWWPSWGCWPVWASLCDLSFSQHGGWVSRGSFQEGVFQRVGSWSCQTREGLCSELWRHYFHSVLLMKATMGLTQIPGCGEIKCPSSWGVGRSHYRKACGMGDVVAAIFGKYEPLHSALSLTCNEAIQLQINFHFHTVILCLIGHRVIFNLFF